LFLLGRLHIVVIKVLEQDGQEEVQEHELPDDQQGQEEDQGLRRPHCAVVVEEDRRPAVVGEHHEHGGEAFGETVEGRVGELARLVHSPFVIEADSEREQLHSEQSVHEQQKEQQHGEVADVFESLRDCFQE